MAGSSFFNRFTPRARQVVVVAQEEALGFVHNYIGSEHILLGLSLAEGSTSAEVLGSMGLTPEALRLKVERIIGRGEEEVDPPVPFTPRAKNILELALREALSLGHRYVGTEHILLGLCRDNEGVASRLLIEEGLSRDAIREAVLDPKLRPLVHAEERAYLEMKGGPVEPDPPAGVSEVEGEAEEVEEVGIEIEEEDEGWVEEEEEEPEGRESDGEELPAEEPIETVPTHSDRPAVEDELGRAQLAEVLAERIRRARTEDTEAEIATPRQRRRKLRRDNAAARDIGSFMVHVYAPWGSGKSSMLNFLATDLRNRGHRDRTTPLKRAGLLDRLADLFRRRQPTHARLSQWIVVEFNAWEHQRLVAPWWWLLAEVQRACGRELWQINRARWLWFRTRDLAWRLWNARAAVIALVLVGGLIAGAWATDWFGLPDDSLTAVRTVVLTAAATLTLGVTVAGLIRGTSKWLAIGSAEGAVRFLKRAHDPLGVYRRRFRWLVRSSAHPITIFIDDLDRCRPDYVVELLEGIQTLFAGEPVAYVVAADRAWLCESFAKSYHEFEDLVGEPGRPLGFLFLEKTFQISLEIPPMSESDRNRYWAKLLSGADNGSRPVAAVGPHAKETQAVTRTELFLDASTQVEIERRVDHLLGASGADRDEVLRAAVRRLNAPDMQEQLERLLNEFTPLLENNPRSMKRLINAYGVERDRLLRAGHVMSRTERRQLAMLTILRLRWPLLADHLRCTPGDAKLFRSRNRALEANHPFASLVSDPEVRKLFNGSVGERLDASLLECFPPKAEPATLPQPG